MEIAEISEDEYQQVVDRLAAHLISDYGAPHIAAALPVAGDEADYAVAICEHELHTLLAIGREFGDEGIEESLKVIRPNAASHEGLKIWGLEED